MLPRAAAWPAELRELVLVSSPETMRTPDGVWLRLIYTDALKRLGYRLVLPELPLARGAALAGQGAVDGLLQRPTSYQELAPLLVRVQEPHFTVYLVAYSVKPMTDLQGWHALLDRDLRVECRRGLPTCEAQGRRYAGEAHFSIANSTELGLRKLVHGRSDLFIDLKYSVEGQLGTTEFQHARIRAVGVMEEFAMHVYLHRKHADLAPRLSAVLRQMKQAGLVEKYRIQAGVCPCRL